jgi:SAM-dependent methyltransferase
MAKGTRFPLKWTRLYPVLGDRFEEAADIVGHYFLQDLYIARKVREKRPEKHLDIGSRLDGFVAHLLTFMDVEVIDIRPLATTVRGLTFVRDDATSLSRYEDGSVQSISSLHAIEHFGLGRYGDEIDVDAWRRVLRSIVRVLAKGGRFYLSLPVGLERVEFNAHRVFSPLTVLEVLEELDLISFTAINDEGQLVEGADPMEYVSARFACGMFEFSK